MIKKLCHNLIVRIMKDKHWFSERSLYETIWDFAFHYDRIYHCFSEQYHLDGFGTGNIVARFFL